MFLGPEYGGEGGQALEVGEARWGVAGAVEYDVFLGVACPAGSSDAGRTGDEFAGACGVVVRSSPELVGVGGVEAVARGQSEG